MPTAQTIKQAKASFAARGRPSLNAQEQRQLERGLELEERAERAKEVERRRGAAAKKRTENELRSRGDKEKAFLGTQRRKDRFGYISSQFHLGAFLVGGGKGKKKHEAVAEIEEEDLFGDEGLDDEVMLNALDVVPVEHARSDSAALEKMIMPPPAVRRSQSTSELEDLMEDFWDDMESSTQIARELGEGEEVSMKLDLEVTGKSMSTRSASFDSVDFDLTAEDLDLLDPPNTSAKEVTVISRQHTMPPPPPPPPAQKHMMPPPAVPSKQVQHTAQLGLSTNIAGLPQSRSATNTMRLPPLNPATAMPSPTRSVQIMPPPVKPVVAPGVRNPQIMKTTFPTPQRPAMSPLRSPHHPTPQQTKSRTAIKGPFLPASSLYCSPDLGFTLTQLESFVDDDIQLTPAIPG